jgi:hypothetical protein
MVVLYGCETWSLTLREERRLRVSENRVLRSISGLKRNEVTGEWRKLHNEELNHLYCSPNIFRTIKSRRVRWVWHVARMGGGEAYTGFWWGYGLVRGGSGWGKVAGTCDCGNEPSGSIKCGEFLDQLRTY